MSDILPRPVDEIFVRVNVVLISYQLYDVPRTPQGPSSIYKIQVIFLLSNQSHQDKSPTPEIVAPIP